MSSNILLFTSQKVLPQELRILAQEIKAIDVSDEGETRFNLNQEPQNIWFSIDRYGLSEFTGQQMRSQAEEILKGVPQSCINIEISRASNSEQLATRLANYLLQHYDGLVLGVRRRIYTRQDLAKMLIIEPEPSFDGAIPT